MATREFEFIVGPETSELPAIGTPTLDDDLISLGYANENYVTGGESVADITALKAVADDANRDNGDIRLVRSTNELYRFDSASAATGDDFFVVVPDAGSGRWLLLTILDTANAFTDTTQSSSTSTGAATYAGGVGIAKNLNVGGNATVTGDLTVNGTTTTVNTDTLDVEDANITVNNGGDQATANANDAGIRVEMSDATDAQVAYDSTLTSKFKTGEVGSESEIIVADGVGVQTLTDHIYDDAKYSESNVTIASNTFAVTDAMVMRVTAGSGPLNTITGAANGEVRVLVNELGSSFVIANDSAAGGFLTGTGANVTLNDDGSVVIIYDTGAARWNIVSAPGVGAGDVTAALSLTDNAIVRGDGGAKGVQTTGITIDDSDYFNQVVANEQFGIKTTNSTTFSVPAGYSYMAGAAYTVATSTTITIAATANVVVFDSITADGDLVVNGDLYVR